MLQKKFRINPKKAWLFKGSFFCFLGGEEWGQFDPRPPYPPSYFQKKLSNAVSLT